jgi:hypothetical protein
MLTIITRIADYFKISKAGPEKWRESANQSFYLLVFTFSVSIAFFAGRTVKFMENKPNFVFESLEQASPPTPLLQRGGAMQIGQENLKVQDVPIIVASKGGKKYYFVWCKGSENIKEKNKRFFKTEDAAKQAGYTLAASCK